MFPHIIHSTSTAELLNKVPRKYELVKYFLQMKKFGNE